jgi:hypothetical protein
MKKIRHAGRKLLVTGAGVGAAIGMLFVVPATAAQSHGGVVHAGTVHANFVSTTADGNGPGPLALHGAISAFCTDNQGPNVDHVVCPTGTFVLDHSAQGGKQNFNMNPSTCIGVFSFSGAPFSVKHGTGAYKGISGNGLAHGTGVEVAPRLADGSCNPDENAAPVDGFTEIAATFTASFAS